MKCCCGIHKEMNSAATAIWAGTAIAFLGIFFVARLDFSLNNLMYWWASAVTLRLLAVETVRFVMLRRKTQ